MSAVLNALVHEITALPPHYLFGRVTAVQGMLVEAGGLHGTLSVGDRVALSARDRRQVLCEVVGFRAEQVLLMPFEVLDGVGLGTRAEMAESAPALYPTMEWKGRVINAMGQPIDGKGPLSGGERAYSIRNRPPPAHTRRRVGSKVDLGVRAINTFLTCCQGQRMGVFAGSGIGASRLCSR